MCKDVGRVIKKFDIYLCDMGEMEKVSGGNIGKTRPCVIISSDEYNDPKNNMYMVAPLRTHHFSDIKSKEDAENVVYQKLQIKRLYVELQVADDDYRFIDITEMKKVSYCKLIKYMYSIINEDIKNKINSSICKYLLSEKEVKEISDHITSSSSDDNSSSSKVSSNALPNISQICDDILNGNITEDEAIKKIGVDRSTFEHWASIGKININKKQDSNDFDSLYDLYTQKGITIKDIASSLGMSYSAAYRRVKKAEHYAL